MVNRLKNLTLLVSIVLCCECLTSFAQGIRWSPPEAGLTVEVPQKLEPDDAYGEESDPNAVKGYGTIWEGKEFLVLILKYSDFCTKNTKEKFDGLFSVIGGDDDYEFKEREIRVNGLPAREVLYTKRGNRGLFVDAGDTVYVLGLVTDKIKDREKAIVRKFFSSFDLTRKASGCKRSK